MNVHGIFAAHQAELDAIGQELALDFDTPAQRIINAGFEWMGVDRFTRAGDDLWEMYVAQKNGWEYTKPSAELRRRWAAY